MKSVKTALLCVLLSATVTGQSRTPLDVTNDIQGLVNELRAMLPPPPPPPPAEVVATVPSGGDLQAALNAGPLIVELAPAEYVGSFRITRTGTVIRGRGAQLRSTSGPAVYITPGTHQVRVQDLSATAAQGASSVVQCGDNVAATQGTIALVPDGIVFERVIIPSHRGKRAFEINCRVQMLESQAVDVYDPAGSDSQAIAVLNTTGPVLVHGGAYSSASEPFLSGGDTAKIPGVVVTGITVEDAYFFHPDSWRTDGVNRIVKNLFELKAGKNVIIRRNRFQGNWVASQPGYAIVFTPRNSQEIQDVVFEDNVVTDVAAVFNVIGQDNVTYVPNRLSGLTIRRNVFITNKTIYGGNGYLMLIGGNPGVVVYEDNIAITDGAATVSYYPGTVKQADGTTVAGGRWTSLRMARNYLVAGLYGLSLNGNQNGASWSLSVDTLEFIDNTITSRTSAESYTRMQAVFPANTYISRASFDALVAPLLQ